MLYNIITGYWHPKVQKRMPNEILIIRCLISELAKLPNWFFTDGQANDNASYHFSNLQDLNQIDWISIQNSNFAKSDGDYDRPRRYQAEFLVQNKVPLESIESLIVFDQIALQTVTQMLLITNINKIVNIKSNYYFKNDKSI